MIDLEDDAWIEDLSGSPFQTELRLLVAFLKEPVRQNT